MYYRQIETFRAVMLAGSASRAAELLDITQPAVSRAIAELERSIGFLLFDRSSGRLMPTHEASLFFAEVDKAFIGLDKLRAEAARIREFGAGSIRIASLSALGNTLVPEAIRTFGRRHPKVPVTLQIHASMTVRALVADGSFDIGLAADEVDVTGVHCEPFGTTHGVCAIPKQHPLAAKTKITPKDLHEHAMVALSPEDKAWRRFQAILSAHDSRPRIIVETPSASTVAALVKTGIGIGIVNPAAISDQKDAGLVLRPFEPAIEFRQLLMFRDSMVQSRLVSRMVDALKSMRRKYGILS